ncbi:hypothetical protein QUF74_06170 [Candidatus Halobeggiatoa sp. HSG11]|nr:hypothetical protein [Candidatus Halobeggiatoa sp. HSG11]
MLESGWLVQRINEIIELKMVMLYSFISPIRCTTLSESELKDKTIKLIGFYSGNFIILLILIQTRYFVCLQYHTLRDAERP